MPMLSRLRHKDRRDDRQEDRQEKREARKPRSSKKPNVLIIFPDDVGIGNVSIYTNGIQGPGAVTRNIDRIGREGAVFTHSYAQNSCTAGRAAMILGQCPFRTGLTSVGMPGSDSGIPQWAPTMADYLKAQGYRTGQFGKNHLGDNNARLPTNFGFDHFFGYLYHLNTMEEPFGESYPKDPKNPTQADPEFLAKFGPRNVVEAWALPEESKEADDPRWGPLGKQKVEDRGPMPKERMPDFDMKEVLPRTVEFIKEAAKKDEPFFAWVCPSRMHVWTHLMEGSEGRSGAGLFADGMQEHDVFVGEVLALLDELKIADDTIVIWSTDNGAERASWPDGGSGFFHGEKGGTEEGGFRVPFLMRWPGVIEPGTWEPALFSFEDLIPTLSAAAGNPNVVEESKKGEWKLIKRLADKNTKVHLDGYNFVPYLSGETDESPRDSFLYFGQSGMLNAVRWRNYKASFARIEGDIFTGIRVLPSAPTITDLYDDPYNVMDKEGQQYMRYYGERLWLFAPVGEVVANFVSTLPEYASSYASTHGPESLNYETAKLIDVMDQLKNFKNVFRDPFQ
jgi:arylsulfatase A-like enzyme